MSARIMIYGATGYTGRLITAELVKLGHQPVLCGRDRAKIEALADRLGLEYRIAALPDADQLGTALDGIRVVVHAAGPFSKTARPMVDACLRRATHYVDITGEVMVIEAMAQRDREARQRRIMMMPAVGFEVVPTDSLALHLARRLPQMESLAIGLKGFKSLTRGSAKTLSEAAGMGIVRRDGTLTPVSLGSMQRWFDYGDGPQLSVGLSWGDVATAFYTTGARNIETYCEATPLVRTVFAANRLLGPILKTALGQVLLQAQSDMLPEGPSPEERERSGSVIVAEGADARGRRVVARLRTPDAYTFSGVTAAAIAHRVTQGDFEIGFQTPARVYGADAVLTFSGVERQDLV